MPNHTEPQYLVYFNLDEVMVEYIPWDSTNSLCLSIIDGNHPSKTPLAGAGFNEDQAKQAVACYADFHVDERCWQDGTRCRKVPIDSLGRTLGFYNSRYTRSKRPVTLPPRKDDAA